MKARPILFSGPMVRALLEGRKTQTRRAVKPQPQGHHWMRVPGYQFHVKLLTGADSCWARFAHSIPQNPEWDWDKDARCPYGKPGDLLWVRETWAPATNGRGALFRADAESLIRWRPSIHMPRWASRLTLRITDVRVQRLQDMEGQAPYLGESDALAEGVNRISHGDGNYYFSAFRDEPHPKNWGDPTDAFREMWESINGPGSWDENPWVWALSFDVIEANVDDVLRGRT